MTTEPKDPKPNAGEEGLADGKAGGKPDGEGKSPELNDGGKIEFTAEQQAAIDQIVADRLKREREKVEKASRKERDDAEAQRLAEEQKWQTLSEKQAEKIKEMEEQTAELDGLKAELEAYKKALEEHVESVRKGLPPEVVELLSKLPVIEQMAYIVKHGESFKKTKKSPEETPDPAKQAELDAASKAQIAEQAKAYYRRSF